MFKEEGLYRDGNQDEYMTKAGSPVFGETERLKDACAKSQHWVNGILKCSCPIRDKNLPNFNKIDEII